MCAVRGWGQAAGRWGWGGGQAACVCMYVCFVPPLCRCASSRFWGMHVSVCVLCEAAVCASSFVPHSSFFAPPSSTTRTTPTTTATPQTQKRREGLPGAHYRKGVCAVRGVVCVCVCVCVAGAPPAPPHAPPSPPHLCVVVVGVGWEGGGEGSLPSTFTLPSQSQEGATAATCRVRVRTLVGRACWRQQMRDSVLYVEDAASSSTIVSLWDA